MNRFEQLIEYVINDEEQKARELFHDIVVEKSREIYENLMAEEAEEELDEAEHEELDEAEHEEELDEAMGGDAADDLIDDVEMDETSDMHMEAEEEEEEVEMDSDDEGGSEPATKDDVMDLADKIDELIADFESKLGDDTAMDDMGDMEDMGDDLGPDEGGDALATDDTDEMMPMAEAVNLKAAPAPVKSEEGGINKKAVYASNSGARGAMANPVKMTGDVAQGRPAPTTKDLIGKVQNTPAQGSVKQGAATKPHLAQATGVNVKSPLPSGSKG